MLGAKAPNYDTCGLLRAAQSSLPLRPALSKRPPDVYRPTILSNIRISWDIYPTFMPISGRVPYSLTDCFSADLTQRDGYIPASLSVLRLR